MTLDDFVGRSVSRETLDRVEAYEKLLIKWNKAINLVSGSTIKQLHERHILDSAQLFPLARKDASLWLDIGSGGGLPAIVVAILAKEFCPQMEVRMVEADRRKSTFLRTAIRETGINASVIDERIEVLEPQDADILSARALAPLTELFAFTLRHRKADGQALFLKGANWQNELKSAQEIWTCAVTPHKSKTDPDAAILEIGALSHD